MDRIHCQSIRDSTEIQHVAVFIQEPLPNQRHTGIAFRVNLSDPLEYLHLAWHCRLCRETRLGTSYFWVDPKIASSRLRQIAGICDDIAHANSSEQIPYSFGTPIGAFDSKTKKFLLGPTATGLTCASFVLSVFETAQLRLARYTGWPKPDEEDRKWQENILNLLHKSKYVSPEHIKAVEREVGTSVRYRPEQVAAAAALRVRRPVKYRHAKSLGDDLVRTLRGEPVDGAFRLSLWERLLDRLGMT
ncbi:hypothetical protein Q31a_30960 [Aureliella helgolandensis]|uniref:Uncharacterized protein n=1 Tax=Aureliella helgolandensis TaxID=2527968 RepID=A0A518G864_9BACT|nr:hypothetical protein Q31a_30960 [Aureliella helgolandensis]